jgi:hypothetical protein
VRLTVRKILSFDRRLNLYDYKTVYSFISIYGKNGGYLDAWQYMDTGQGMGASMCTEKIYFL